MSALTFAPVTREQANTFVHLHHSHHEPRAVDIFRIGAYDAAGDLVAVAISGRPQGPGLVHPQGKTQEVTRHCVSSSAPRYAASRILGALARGLAAFGVDLLVSYTRVDERGSCYLAAGFVPVAVVKGRGQDTGNRALRWLPGLHQERTEVIDRVRWERGPRAGREGARWDGDVWRASGAVQEAKNA